MAIESRQDRQVFEIVINRESSLNAFDTEHLKALEKCLDEAADNPSVRAVLLRGSGRAFSVGGDIKAMDRMTDAEFAEATDLYQSLCRKARAMDKPIIAAINGYALGGGLEIALIADLRIAAESAKLGLPDAELGFSPSGGLTYQLNHLVGAGWALHLALTCEILDAAQALSIGLVTRVVADADLNQIAMELAQQVAAYPPTGIRNVKQAFNAALHSNLEATLELEAKFDKECYRSAETRQALRDFIESRKT
jgi:enoyl-CoA hydratase